MSDNSTANRKQRYRQVYEALSRASIPTREQGISLETFAAAVGRPENNDAPPYMNREVARLIYDTPERWTGNCTFVIEGTRRRQYANSDSANSPENSVRPDWLRRRVGFAILSMGIVTAVLNDLPPLDHVGKYIDFDCFINSVKDRYAATKLMDDLSEYRHLFLSEIGHSQSPHPSTVEIGRTYLDDLLRRRQDAELVTILSFRESCIEAAKRNVYGREIYETLKVCQNLPTMLLASRRLCKIALAPIINEEGMA